MEQWYCGTQGNRYGPVDTDTLRHWLAEGRLQPTDVAWTEGMEEWQTIFSIPQFQHQVPSSTPVVQDTHYAAGESLPNAPGAVGSMVCGIVGVVCTIFAFAAAG